MAKENNTQKNTLGIKKRVTAFIFVLVTILIIPAIAMVKFPTKEQRFVSSFMIAVQIGDMNKLKEHISFEDGRVLENNLSSKDDKIDTSIPNEVSILGFLKFIKKDPNYQNSLKEALERKISYQNRQKNIQSNENQFDNMFKIKKKIKNGKFYDDYTVEVKRYTLNINTNIEEGRIVFENNKTIPFDKVSSAKVGPLIAGEYWVKVLYNGQYTEGISSEKIIDVSNFKNNDLVDISIPLDYKMINIDSNQKDAKVFINKKKTEFSVENAKNIGPITSGTTIHLEKEIENVGVMVSDAITVGESMDVFIKLPVFKLSNNDALNGKTLFEDKIIDHYLRDIFKDEYTTMKDIMKTSKNINYIESADKFYINGKSTVENFTKLGLIGLKDDGTIYGALTNKIPYVIHYYSNDKNKEKEIPDEYMGEWLNSLNLSFVEFMNKPLKKATKQEISGLYEMDKGAKLVGIKYLENNKVQFEARIQNESNSSFINGEFELEDESYAHFKSSSLTTTNSMSLKFAFYKNYLKIIDENSLGTNKNYFTGTYIKK